MRTEDLVIGQEYLESDRANWRSRGLNDYGMRRVRFTGTEERRSSRGRGMKKIPMVLQLDPKTGEPKEYGNGVAYEPQSTIASRIKGLWSELVEQLEKTTKAVSDWRFDAERRGAADGIAVNNGRAELGLIGIASSARRVQADMGGSPPGEESGMYASFALELSADQADRLSMFLIALSDVVDVRVRPDGSGWDFRPVAGLEAADLTAAARPDGFTP